MKYVLVIVSMLACISVVGQEIKTVDDINSYFTKRIQYPQDAIDHLKDGYVLVSFKWDGKKVHNMEVLYAEHEDLAFSVKEAIKNNVWMGVGRNLSGKTIVLPVYFKLEREEQSGSEVFRYNGKQRVISEKTSAIENAVFVKPVVLSTSIIY